MRKIHPGASDHAAPSEATGDAPNPTPRQRFAWTRALWSRFAPYRTTARAWYRAFRTRTRWADTPLALALTVRVALFAVASVAARLIAPEQGADAITIWNRWDTVWYTSITANGYTYSPTLQSSAVFYPLYPLLLWLLQYPLGLLEFLGVDPALAAGMVTSWVSFLAACALLYAMTQRRFGQPTAYGAVLLLATFPFGVFFGAAYTESLFLLLALLAFESIERRRWWIAAVAALLAGASRPPGMIVGACVALAYAWDWIQTRHRLRWDVLSLALIPSGTLAYLGYCYYQFGEFFAPMITSEAGWRRGAIRWDGLIQGANLLVSPQTWLWGTDYKQLLFGLYTVLALGFLLATPLVWKRLGPIYTFYTLAGILTPILTCDVMVSEGRYLSVVFPVFIVAAQLLRDRPNGRLLLALVGALFLSLFTVMFVLNFAIY